jgi:hypothetical protein
LMIRCFLPPFNPNIINFVRRSFLNYLPTFSRDPRHYLSRPLKLFTFRNIHTDQPILGNGSGLKRCAQHELGNNKMEVRPRTTTSRSVSVATFSQCVFTPP